MATDRFSINEAIGFGWNTTKTNFVFFIGITVIVLATQFHGAILQGLLHVYKLPSYPIDVFIGLVVGPVVNIGVTRISLRFCDNQKGKFSDFFTCLHLFFKYLAGTILYGLIVIGGMLLLIVPGIIWSIKFQYYGYFIVDKGFGPIKALEASSNLTDGIKWDLFLFGLLLFCINLLGLLCLVVGSFATVPTTMVANAFVYRRLESQLDVNQTSIRDIARNG